MDEGADRIAQDMKEIVQTRVAIAEKLGAIEQHVGATMQHARTTMTQVANKTTSSVRQLCLKAVPHPLNNGRRPGSIPSIHLLARRMMREKNKARLIDSRYWESWKKSFMTNWEP
jgi:hypothetical protein